MVPLIAIFNLISEQYHDKNWEFNFDLLETNVINIVLLVGSLTYVLKKFLGATLIKRQEKVLLTIQEAENQLYQAKNRLTEAEKQLIQSKTIMKQIQLEAVITAKRVRESILEQGKLDIQRLTNASKLSIKTIEKQIRKQIQQQITSLAMTQVSIKLKEQMSTEMQLHLINQNISQLGDKL